MAEFFERRTEFGVGDGCGGLVGGFDGAARRGRARGGGLEVLHEAQAGDGDLAEIGVDAGDEFDGEVLQFHRHRAGAADGEGAGEEFARLADGGEGGADDLVPVGHHLGGGGGAFAEGGAHEGGHQGGDGAGAVDMALVVVGFARHTRSMPAPDFLFDWSTPLLDWYDRSRRRMPWRALPGEAADPYRVWLSEIMLQQTTVAAVIPYYEKFLSRFPDVAALGAAESDAVMRAWAGLGYYARARNLHACAKAVVALGGFPRDIEGLRALPGIGAYTAAAVGAIAFGLEVVPVDGNVERVVSRVFAIEGVLPGSKPEIRAGAALLGASGVRPADFAQALFDLGATICTPRNPACAICPWRAPCVGQARGIAAELPRKAAKKARPLRHGAVFWLQDDTGRVLLRRRVAKGLLGGMIELPGTAWRAEPWAFDEAQAAAPAAVAWRHIGQVEHGFTHFALHLDVYVGQGASNAAEGFLVDGAAVEGEALPSVMSKCVRLIRERTTR